MHREQLTYVDTVLAGCAAALESRGKVSETKVRGQRVVLGLSLSDSTSVRSQATKQLVSLLTAPLDAYDVVSVLSLSSYPKARIIAHLLARRVAEQPPALGVPQVMDVLEHNTRKQMAVTIVRCVLKSGTIVQEVEQVDMLFEFISLLIKGDDAFPDAVRLSRCSVPSSCLHVSASERGRGRL